MSKTVLTERDIVNAVKEGKKILFADGNTVITPSAKDKAKELNLQFTDTKESPEQSRQVKAAESYTAATISSTNVVRSSLLSAVTTAAFKRKRC